MGAPIPRLSPPGCQTKGEQPGGSACMRRGRGRRSGKGVTKAHFALQKECVLYGSPRGESIDPGAVTRTAARGFTAFFLASSCSPLAAAHPKLAAAKGEQGENDEPLPIFPPYLHNNIR